MLSSKHILICVGWKRDKYNIIYKYKYKYYDFLSGGELMSLMSLVELVGGEGEIEREKYIKQIIFPKISSLI